MSAATTYARFIIQALISLITVSVATAMIFKDFDKQKVPFTVGVSLLTAVIILGVTNALLLMFVTYLFFSVQKQKKKVQEVLDLGAQERIQAYNEISKTFKESIKAQELVIATHEEKLEGFLSWLEDLSKTPALTDPKKIAEGFEKLGKLMETPS